MAGKNPLMAGCALLALAAGSPALAQDPLADKDDTPAVGEITVTAEHRAESLQTVPLAITAYDDKTRDLAGILSIQDMAQFTPGVSYSTAADRPFIRGIGRESNFSSLDSPVANYIDGVYTSSVQDASRRPMFIERTEILRGPQGALSGRGSIAGAVNTISKRPAKTFGGAIGAMVGDYDRYGLEGTVTGPITDYLRYRANLGVYRQGKGWFTNLANGDTEGDQPNNRNIYDLMLAGDVGPMIEVFVKAAFADYDETFKSSTSLSPYQAGANPCVPNAYGGVLVPSANYGYFSPDPAGGNACGTTGTFNNQADVLGGHRTNPASPDNLRVFNTNFRSNARVDNNHNYTGDVVWHAPWADVRYIGGHQAFDYIQHLDADGTAVNSFILPGTTRRVNPNGINLYEEDRTWFSHELNIASTGDGPVQWIFGLYQSLEDYDQQPQSQVFGGYDELNAPYSETTFSQVGVAANPVGFRSQYGELIGWTRSSAAFAQIDYAPDRQWKITAGLRFNKDQKFAHEQTRLVYNNSALLAGGGLFGKPAALDLTGSTAPGYTIIKAGVPTTGFNVVDISALPTTTLANGNRVVTLPNGAGSATLTPGAVIGLAQGVVGLPYVDPATGYRQRDLKDEWQAITGDIGVDYQMNDDTLIYARYARGYRPGGFNGGGFISSKPEVDEETVDSYEIGAKTTLNGSLRLNSAIFYYDYKDIQLPLATYERCLTPGDFTTCTAVNSFVNLPSARNEGFELEGVWAPTNDFMMIFSYGYLDTEITDGKTPTGYQNSNDPAALLPGAQPLIATNLIDTLTGKPVTTQDLTGNPVAFAPTNKFAVNANYTFRRVLDLGDVTMSASYIWTGSSYSDFFNNKINQTPRNSQTNLRALFHDKDRRYQIVAYVQNVFDRDVVEFGSVTRRRPPDNSVGQTYYKTFDLAPPRTFGVEVQRRF